MLGRSVRSLRPQVSVGEPQSRSSNTASIAFSLGLDNDCIEFDLPVLPQADVTVCIHQSGQNRTTIKNVIRMHDRRGADANINDPQFGHRLVGQHQIPHVHAHSAATSCLGTSVWTSRKRPAQAAAR